MHFPGATSMFLRPHQVAKDKNAHGCSYIQVAMRTKYNVIQFEKLPSGNSLNYIPVTKGTF